VRPPRARLEEKKDMPAVKETVEQVKSIDVDLYKYGFVTDIESDLAPRGLNEDIVRFISAKKGEPEWLTEWRLDAYRRWLTMRDPSWSRVKYPQIDYQALHYYAAPKGANDGPKSLDEVDPELRRTYEKLGISQAEQEILAGVAPANRVAVDFVFDSVSVVTTFKEELAKAGVIFCPISEAVKTHPELVQNYLGSVVPTTDNYFATLNSAVFSDGSFVYIPPGVRCPMELSTYFRINEQNTGQFERTLIIADKGSYVSYLEGCTAPKRDENQLHAAVVELIALDDAEIKYSTVQNWYPGDAEGKGGIYNFVTKRGDCRGARSKISWTQVETGSAITWKYPSCILRGDESTGEFYSIAVSNGMQQVDSGTKMIHLGRNTKSKILAKGISAGRSDSTYRGQVSMHRRAKGARNFTNCDSLLIGDRCGAHTIPYIECNTNSGIVEHEATTSKIAEDQLFYCMQRGLSEEEAVALVVNGFVKEVLQQLPMEFAVEAQKLISISLEGSVG
jgi:Fe-S cluster assembly protein SufB